jgi:thymidylate synthase (FAD)
MAKSLELVPGLEPELQAVLSPPMSVSIIGRTQFDRASFDSFLHAEDTSWRHAKEATDAELLVEAAGRVCYMSFGDKQYRVDYVEYLRNLIRNGHESVLEHVNWSILITGISRALTHQLVRHRAGFAFSQLSQQYHDETEALFAPPYELRQDLFKLRAWARMMLRFREVYADTLSDLTKEQGKMYSSLAQREKKRAVRSAARGILPNCTETKIVTTANARALRHFLSVRGAIPGDYEMRELSVKLLSVVGAEAPHLFVDFRTATLPDGSASVERVSLEHGARVDTASIG